MHRTGMVSGQLHGIHQKWPVASKFAWSMDYHVSGAMSEAYHKLHPEPKSITDCCRWFGTACHKNQSTRLLKAAYYDCRDAQKLVVNSSSTKSDCQTSDTLFTVLFQWCCFAVFWRKHSAARKSRKVVAL